LRILRDQRGQALAEMALVLPVFLLAFILYFQLIVLCHNAIVLQDFTAQTARSSALTDTASLSNSLQNLRVVTQLLGAIKPPSLHRTSELITPWRPFKGLGKVVRTQGYLVNTEVSSGNLPFHFLGWQFPFESLKFSAEFPKEPPIPEEE
jgi:hypothetical protein